MWIFTPLGFFSVVTKANTVHVRARAKADIEALVDLAATTQSTHGAPDIHEGDGDYPFRVLLTPEEWRNLGGWFLEEPLDYPNFKDAVKAKDPERAGIYMGVWSHLAARLGTGWDSRRAALEAQGVLWRDLEPVELDCPQCGAIDGSHLPGCPDEVTCSECGMSDGEHFLDCPAEHPMDEDWVPW